MFLCVRRGEERVAADGTVSGAPAIADIGLFVAGVERVPDHYEAVELSFDGRPAVLATGAGSTRWMLCYKRLPPHASEADTAISEIDVIWADKGDKPVEVGPV